MSRHPGHHHTRSCARSSDRARVETRSPRARTSSGTCCARSSDRARVETIAQPPASGPACSGCARSSDRARVETLGACGLSFRSRVAPGPRTGRGLKRDARAAAPVMQSGCARSSDRARVETRTATPRTPGREVAPGPRTGRGLKLDVDELLHLRPGCARSSDRARVETTPMATVICRWSPVAPGPRTGRGLKHLRPERLSIPRRRLRPVLGPGEG